MKTTQSILIEKACSGDATRPVLNSVYLEKLTGQIHPARLLATNGRIAAIVPTLVDEADTSGYITAAALKAARKCAGKMDAVTLAANGKLTMPDGQQFDRPDHGKYPNFYSVIPKDETQFSLRLDPALLHLLAQAIGAERGVILEFCGEGKALRVKPCHNPRAESEKGKLVRYEPACMDALGLIMPIVSK